MKKSPLSAVCSLQKKVILLAVGFWLLVLGLYGCQNKDMTLHKDTQIVMGTFVEVISPDGYASGIAFAEMIRIEGLLSKYKEDSEVSRLNKAGELSVSPETRYIIEKAKEFWLTSGGAFDISVGPLLDLWGFTSKNYHMPEKEGLEKILSKVGSDKIVFQDANNVVKFKIPGMKIDLGAIAKGYAVDCAVRKLKERGINSCLINAGGDIYCLGGRFNKPWNIAIQNPRRDGIVGYFQLKDAAVATSGDYEQYFINKQNRYGHIFDPKTGYPSKSGVISVTVVAPDCLTADALATAVFVLGKEKGEELARKFSGTEVRVIEESGCDTKS